MATIRGGDKLELALAKIAAQLAKPGTLRVGFLSGSTYPDGTSVPMVAALNEYGAPSRGQPPRPAFRNMVDAKKGEWPKAIAGLLKPNDYDTERVLKIVGTAIAGQLKKSILDITAPPLAPSTIKRKGFDKPWIDTSVLVNSIDFEVE